MPIKIQFDNNHNAITPTIVLSNRAGQKIGVLNNTCAFNLTCNMNSASELTFDIYKELDGVECPYWYQITDFKLIWCREWDKWFEIKVEVSDSGYVKKSITATSLAEAELGQINLYGIQINTESDIARDDYTKPTVFYNEDDPSISLLNRIMYKTPHYRIKHVDSKLANIQRSFSFDNTSLYDAMQEIAEEVDCLFIFDSGSTTDGKIDRTIAVYDLESNCIDCGYRGEFIDECPECGSTNVLNGYGTDTTVFVSTENLADGIEFSTETGSVKNCFRLTAGDDLMTATIANCNPNGTSYIWYISDQVKKDMPDELASKIDAYDKLYNDYQTSHEITVPQAALSSYNTIASAYDYSIIASPIAGYPKLVEAIYEATDLYYYLKTSMMPTPQTSDTTAAKEVAKLTAAALSPVAVTDVSVVSLATANSAVLAMAKCIADSRYKIQIETSVLNSQTWTGAFRATSYSDEDDTAVSSSVSITITDDYQAYVKQMIDKSLNKSSDNSDFSISSILKKDVSALKVALAEYSLDSLQSFNNACQSCLDILIDQGISDKSAYEGAEVDMYTLVYLPYYEKKQAIEAEMDSRSTAVDTVSSMIDTLDGLRTDIQTELNFENYIGAELWQTFCAYRREDTYSNSNYISDGLSNAELVQKAQQFITVAQKEIYKSAELQHSISATMYNLLVMQEFEPLCNYFEVGNWIRVGLDDQVYRLRLLSYAIDFDSLANITVSFSDVTKNGSGLADTESVFKQASSMASSYSSTQRQAEAGATAERTVESWYTDSMSLTNMAIVGDADNQNISLSNHGLVAKEYLPITDEYSDEQLKIINKGVYLTDDNWKTSRAGIGKFKYYNPKTGAKEDAYGVIADTIVGNIVLSKQVGVYNQDGSVVIDPNGVTIDVDGDDPENSAGFKIQKHYTDSSGTKQTEQIFYVNSDGQLVMNGNVRLQTSSSKTTTIGGAISGAQTAAQTATSTATAAQSAASTASSTASAALTAANSSVATVTTQYYDSTSATEMTGGSWSDTSPTWQEGHYIWSRTKTVSADGKTTEYSEAVCITGNTGIQGAQGAKGDKGDTGAQGAAGADYSQGKMLYTDPTFDTGVNSCGVYNNTGNGNVTITRSAKSSDNPFDKATYELVIANKGTASPECGGFYFANRSRASARFIYRIIAKIPTGYTLAWSNNAYGSGGRATSRTSMAGTGKFQEYIFEAQCGAIGNFSTIGFFFLHGTVGTADNPVTWYVAYATCFDMTGSSDVQTAQSTADQANTDVQALSTTVVQTYVTSAQLDDRITSEVGTLTTTIAGNKETIEKRVSAVEQTSGEWSATVSKHTEYIKKLDGDVQAVSTTVSKTMKLTEEGLTLSAGGSTNTVLITNDSINFKVGEYTAAYISDKQLWIKDAVIENSMTLGKFAFIPRDSGNLSLVRKDG